MSTSINPKTYVYHSYKNGAFQGILTNVISDPTYQQEINSSGSSMDIVIAAAADSYSEGSLIDFNNDIQIYEIDDKNPNGVLFFRGFIVNYKPVFSDNNQEQVVVTIMGYGATLNDYMIESLETIDVNQNSQNGNTVSIFNTSRTGESTQVYQSFVVGAGITRLSAISLWLAAASSFYIGATVSVTVYSTQADVEATTNALGSVTLPLTSTTAQAYKFTFGASLTVTAGNTYYARLDMVTSDGSAICYYDNTNPYAAGAAKTGDFLGGIYTWSSLTGDIYLITYSNTGNTQVVFNSVDPSYILQQILTNYMNQGGQITYTAASIDMTGSTVSYTFNTNTVFEGINKVASLAPVGWYFYIDQTNNVLHFHKVASTANHTFALSKNVKNLSIEKRAQDIVNVVYFVGGPVAGANLYNKYVLQSSINIYGRHSLRYSDNNVTLSSTAQIISNNILSTRGGVELRIELEILDDGGDINSVLGFDIESITLGESISFRSFGPGTGGSLWDNAKWDIAKWDFDITDLSSVVVQVTKLSYSPDILSLSLSTVPPDITKRVEDIYRNLQQVNVLVNPVAPS